MMSASDAGWTQSGFKIGNKSRTYAFLMVPASIHSGSINTARSLKETALRCCLAARNWAIPSVLVASLTASARSSPTASLVRRPRSAVRLLLDTSGSGVDTSQ